MSRHQREALVVALGEQLNALLSASRALTELASHRFHPDLQPAAFYIALWLASFGPAKATVVADAVAMDRSASSRLTKRLIEVGFLKGLPDPDDGRGTVLHLTALGRERVGAATHAKADEYLARIEGWPDDDLVALIQLLGKFNGRTAT